MDKDNIKPQITKVMVGSQETTPEELLKQHPQMQGILSKLLGGEDIESKQKSSSDSEIAININLGEEKDIFEPLYPILATAKKLADSSASEKKIINTGLLLCALLEHRNTNISKEYHTLPYNMLDALYNVTKFSFFAEGIKSKVFDYDCSKEVRDIIYTTQLFNELSPHCDVLDVVSALILAGEQNVGKLAFTNLLKTNYLKIQEKLMYNIFSENSSSNNTIKEELLTKKENLPTELINLSTYMATKHPVLAKRDKELKQVQNALCTMEKPNAMLVGPAGTGKSAIVEYLAYLLEQGKGSSMLKGKKVYQLNMASLVSGSRYVGDLENKFIRLMKNIMSNPNAIVFVDEAHTMVGAGRGQNGNNDVSQLLKPYLARDGFSMIGATTEKEYEKYIQPDEAFARRFQVIRILEPSIEDTVDMLSIQKAKRESFYNIQIDEELIPFIVDIASKKIKDSAFPDKAITLLDRACVQAVWNRTDKNNMIELTQKNVEDVFDDESFEMN